MSGATDMVVWNWQEEGAMGRPILGYSGPFKN